MSTARIVAASLAAASAALVLPATTAATAQAAPAPVPFTIAVGKVTAHSLTIRGHATAASSALGYFHQGDLFNPVCSVVGQSVGGNRTWYWAQGPSNGWVSAHYVRLQQGRVPACSADKSMHLMNARISSASQVATKLAKTSPSFRAFITQHFDTRSNASCRKVISVDAWWDSDQALGSVQDCAGYLTLWTLRNGRWTELGAQSLVPCADIRRAGARHAINGNTGWACTVPSSVRGRQDVVAQYRPGN